MAQDDHTEIPVPTCEAKLNYEIQTSRTTNLEKQNFKAAKVGFEESGMV